MRTCIGVDVYVLMTYGSIFLEQINEHLQKYPSNMLYTNTISSNPTSKECHETGWMLTHSIVHDLSP